MKTNRPTNSPACNSTWWTAAVGGSWMAAGNCSRARCWRSCCSSRLVWTWRPSTTTGPPAGSAIPVGCSCGSRWSVVALRTRRRTVVTNPPDNAEQWRINGEKRLNSISTPWLVRDCRPPNRPKWPCTLLCRTVSSSAWSSWSRSSAAARPGTHKLSQ